MCVPVIKEHNQVNYVLSVALEVNPPAKQLANYSHIISLHRLFAKELQMFTHTHTHTHTHIHTQLGDDDSGVYLHKISSLHLLPSFIICMS